MDRGVIGVWERAVLEEGDSGLSEGVGWLERLIRPVYRPLDA